MDAGATLVMSKRFAGAVANPDWEHAINKAEEFRPTATIQMDWHAATTPKRLANFFLRELLQGLGA